MDYYRNNNSSTYRCIFCLVLQCLALSPGVDLAIFRHIHGEWRCVHSTECESGISGFNTCDDSDSAHFQKDKRGDCFKAERDRQMPFPYIYFKFFIFMTPFATARSKYPAPTHLYNVISSSEFLK